MPKVPDNNVETKPLIKTDTAISTRTNHLDMKDKNQKQTTPGGAMLPPKPDQGAKGQHNPVPNIAGSIRGDSKFTISVIFLKEYKGRESINTFYKKLSLSISFFSQNYLSGIEIIRGKMQVLWRS